MARTLAFYRRLGLVFPDDSDGAPHVDIALPGGLRLAFDSVDTIRSFDPAWTPPTGGHRVGLAFRCDTPEDVDRTYAELTNAGHDGFDWSRRLSSTGSRGVPSATLRGPSGSSRMEP